jgi:glycine betaine/choline ABC-type transport system substrate-binding protein
LDNSSRKDIVVASKPTAEQYILGEIISQLVENNTDIHVIRKFGIGGGTSNIHPAMLKGEIDVYPEYTGTAWLFVLKEPQINNPDSLYSALKKAYADKFRLNWICRLGFNNTFTLALPESMAQKEHLITFSDLAAKSSQFSFGAEFDFFEREDGFTGLNKVYPFNFKDKVELDVNLKFQALENHTVDVINAFSTDSRIRQMNLRVLKDDKLFFPAYQAGIVIRYETQQKYPELTKLFERLEGLIDDATMLQMNYEVEIEKKSPNEVAQTFLKSHELIK